MSKETRAQVWAARIDLIATRAARALRAEVRRWELTRRMSPPRLLVASFLLLSGLGTLGLRFLPGLYTGEPLGWLDSWFTATSAVCVTGLIVVDTATYFTPWGKAYLLLLIQLGGLGIITLASVVIVTLGRRMSLHQEALSQAGAEISRAIDVRNLVRNVVLFTLSFELVGAVGLACLWIPSMGWVEGSGHAVFHSISAFCNAGFSTFSDSLTGFQRAPSTLLLVAGLITAGGLGFLTMEEVRIWWRARVSRRRYRVSIHSRLVLLTSGCLLVSGWFLFTLFEWSLTLGDLPPGARVLNGLFMSVTARTAGFNTVDYAQTSEASSFLTILLMSIGGSPGSTAGGIKTTTFAVLGVLAFSRLRGLRTAQIWHRSIPEGNLQRAVGLFVVAFGFVTVGIFGYTVTEIGLVTGSATQGQFLIHMFEAVSAFNTVGLSMGATSHLSDPGKLLTIVFMLLGRVGPLTFAAALALHRRPANLQYAREEVVIG